MLFGRAWTNGRVYMEHMGVSVKETVVCALKRMQMDAGHASGELDNQTF